MALFGIVFYIFVVILLSAFLYNVCICVYNVFFHRLSGFRGPILSAASPLPLIYHSLRGDGVHWIVSLHGRYGEVVRVSPNELSFSGADAWKSIYGHRKHGEPGLSKDPAFYIAPGAKIADIVNADTETHARMRRVFAHAFSDRALKMQEPLFLTHVDKLVAKLRTQALEKPAQKVDMVNMYNFTTFDIMGDLTFGEPLHMLDDTSYHPWVSAMLGGFRFGVYLHAIRHYPRLESLLLKLIPTFVREKQKLHNEFSVARVERRLEKDDARPDIWGLVLGTPDHRAISKHEMYANAKLFMVAGTETTATLLSGLTFHLLDNPAKLAKLVSEIRSAFRSETEISIERLQQLRYLNACLEEGLRIFPPVSAGLPRLVPGAGVEVDGRYVPAKSRIFVTHFAAYRNPHNFKNPYDFVPERWLSEATPSPQDKLHALQPFSLGPRACLGRNMAYHEMRLILSKLLYNFDLQLCGESEQWSDQKIYIMWNKKPLYCSLRPVSNTGKV